MDRYLTEREVSALTGLALPTLRGRRATHQLPVYYKIGRSVRYKFSDVEAFMEARRIVPGGEAA